MELVDMNSLGLFDLKKSVRSSRIYPIKNARLVDNAVFIEKVTGSIPIFFSIFTVLFYAVSLSRHKSIAQLDIFGGWSYSIKVYYKSHYGGGVPIYLLRALMVI
jgi:hypothetical protein